MISLDYEMKLKWLVDMLAKRFSDLEHFEYENNFGYFELNDNIKQENIKIAEELEALGYIREDNKNTRYPYVKR